jgi:hypothetical protein
MRVSIKATSMLVISVITVILLYSVYNYMTQLEVPLWMIQFTFYAFMTAFFGFILGIFGFLIRDHFQGRKTKKIEEKRRLESLRTEYSRCADTIGSKVIGSAKKSESVTLTAKLYEQNIFGKKPEIFKRLQEQVQKLNEECKLYNALHEGSECLIKTVVEEKVKKEFPKTLKLPRALDEHLLADFLMCRYFDGEKITESWLKDVHPMAFKNIAKDTHESERDKLDILFHELNKIFRENSVLQLYRKEKKELIEQSEKILRNLEREINSLDEQLSKYSSLDINVIRPVLHPR